MALLKIDQRVIRSIFTALRQYAVELGYYPDTSIYDNPTAPDQIADFKNKLREITNTKGFYIDFFSESSARNKGEKIAPRMVIAIERAYNGEIGAPPSQILAGTVPGTFKTGSLPGQAANLNIGVYCISHNSEQTYVLNGIKDDILGQRNYIYLYDAPEEQPFYIYQTAYYNLDDPVENITERAYIYTVPDLYLGNIITHRDNIKPIGEIHVDIENPKDDGITVKDN